jgi:NAD(P)-dependent dehydrogenase (short-subunit alcohol dehydrogenase family)
MGADISRKRVNGRLVFATIGAGGIGCCTAEALANAGTKVVISALDVAKPDMVAESLRPKGFAVETTALDVTDPAAQRRRADLCQHRDVQQRRQAARVLRSLRGRYADASDDGAGRNGFG